MELRRFAWLGIVCALLAHGASGQTTGLSYFTVTPCRLVDTRSGPPLATGTATFPVAGICGVPVGTVAVALNITAVNPSGGGFVALFPPTSPVPLVSNVNFNAGRTRAGNGVIQLSSAGEIEVSVVVAGGGATHVVLDVAGYFAEVPPVAVDDVATLAEDAGATAIDVLGNDTDPDGGTKAIFAVTQPAHGTVVPTGGSPGAATGLTYAPEPDSCNEGPPVVPDVFTYTLTPGGDVGQVAVTVTCVNDPPAPSGGPFAVSENAADGTVLGTVAVTDPDVGQTHSFAITAGNGTGVFAIDAAGVLTVLDHTQLDADTTPSYSLTVQATDDGSPVLSGTTTVVVDVTDVNEPPVVSGGPFSLAENTAAGTTVGTVTAADPDAGQTHAWAITAGNAGNAFSIDTAGVLHVATPAALDFESTPSFSLTVQATDDGTPPLAGSATVVVQLTDVNEPPVPTGGPFTVAEGSTNGTVVGTVAHGDPDAGQTHAFAITAGNPGGAFAIDAAGQLTVANAPLLDHETTPVYTLTVQATDDGTPVLSGTTTVTVNVTDANEPPVVTGGTFTLAENSANGSAVGSASVSDPDPGQTHTWAITAGNTGGAFAIGPTGALTVASAAALDFETTPTFTLTVQATDDGTPPLAGSATVTVNLTDVNEAPVPAGGPFTVAENSANGAAVGTVAANDPDTGQTHTFTLTAGNVGGVFAIAPATGAITVANGSLLDHETTASYNLTVQVADDGSPVLTGTTTVVVNVGDVNEAPVVSPASFAIAENSPNGTTVGTVAFADPDAGQTHTFAITAGNTGGAFAIDAAGVIHVATSAAVNFETTPTFGLTVQVTDDGAPVLAGTATVTVTLTDVNEAPVPSGGPFGVAENSAAGTTVGTVTVSDPDAGQSHGFAITAGNTGGAFAISGGGTITVANPAALDFETTPSFSLTVQTTDDGTPVLSGATTVVVTLGNVNEPPAPSGGPFTLAENSPAGTTVGTVTFTDPDVGQGHTFAITGGNTGGAFAIDGGGTLTVANAAAVDFETTPTFSLTVQVTDDGTPVLSGSTTVVVNLTDQPEPPTVLGTARESFTTIGNTLLEVSETPVEPLAVHVHWKLANNYLSTNPPMTFSLLSASPGAVVTIDPSSGAFTYLPPAGQTTPDTFVVRITDAFTVLDRTITIDFAETVWYVANDAPAGGDGRSNAPFDTLLEAQSASAAGQWIFVDYGDGTTAGQDAGVALKNGQHLVGEFEGLSIPVAINGNPSPVVLLVPPAVDACGGLPCRPMLDDTAAAAPDGAAATDAIPAEISGLNLAGGVNGIDVTTLAAFAGAGDLLIQDNVVRAAGAEGIDLDFGGSGNVRLAVRRNTVTSTGTGIDVRETGTGTLTVTAFDDNVIEGDTGGSGIVLARATLDADPAAGIQTVAGGNTTIGAPANPVGGAGLRLDQVLGALAYGTLAIDNAAGTGLYVRDAAGKAGTFALSNAGGTITSAGGPAVDIDPVALSLTFAALTSSNSAGNGVTLDTVSGSFTVTGATTVTAAAQHGVFLKDATAALSFASVAVTDTGATGDGLVLDNTNVPNVADPNGAGRGSLSVGSATITRAGANGVNIVNASSVSLASITVAGRNAANTADVTDVGLRLYGTGPNGALLNTPLTRNVSVNGLTVRNASRAGVSISGAPAAPSLFNPGGPQNVTLTNLDLQDIAGGLTGTGGIGIEMVNNVKLVTVDTATVQNVGGPGVGLTVDGGNFAPSFLSFKSVNITDVNGLGIGRLNGGARGFHLLRHVHVTNAKGDGVLLDGNATVRELTDVHVLGVTGRGIVGTFDTTVAFAPIPPAAAIGDLKVDGTGAEGMVLSVQNDGPAAPRLVGSGVDVDNTHGMGANIGLLRVDLSDITIDMGPTGGASDLGLFASLNDASFNHLTVTRARGTGVQINGPGPGTASLSQANDVHVLKTGCLVAAPGACSENQRGILLFNIRDLAMTTVEVRNVGDGISVQGSSATIDGATIDTYKSQGISFLNIIDGTTNTVKNSTLTGGGTDPANDPLGRSHTGISLLNNTVSGKLVIDNTDVTGNQDNLYVETSFSGPPSAKLDLDVTGGSTFNGAIYRPVRLSNLGDVNFHDVTINTGTGADSAWTEEVGFSTGPANPKRDFKNFAIHRATPRNDVAGILMSMGGNPVTLTGDGITIDGAQSSAGFSLGFGPCTADLKNVTIANANVAAFASGCESYALSNWTVTGAAFLNSTTILPIGATRPSGGPNYAVTLSNVSLATSNANSRGLVVGGNGDGSVAISGLSVNGAGNSLEAGSNSGTMTLTMGSSTLANPSAFAMSFSAASGSALALSGTGNTVTLSPPANACAATSGTVTGSVGYNGAAHCP